MTEHATASTALAPVASQAPVDFDAALRSLADAAALLASKIG